LREDRAASYAGLRLADFHASDHHAIKAGVDYAGERFRSDSFITTGSPTNITDNTRRHGTQFGAVFVLIDRPALPAGISSARASK